MAEIIDLSTLKNKKEETNEDTSYKNLIEKRKAAISKLSQYHGEVISKNNIRSLPNTEVGDIYWVEMDNKAYIVAEKDKKKIKIQGLDETASISTGIPMIEVQRQLMSKEEPIDWNDKELEKILKERIVNWLNKATYNDCYLLYSRELHYITLFKQGGHQEFFPYTIKSADTIFNTLKEIGDVLFIEFDDGGDTEAKVEIWIRTKDSKAELFYLFPYDRGVIELN